MVFYIYTLDAVPVLEDKFTYTVGTGVTSDSISLTSGVVYKVVCDSTNIDIVDSSVMPKFIFDVTFEGTTV